MSQLLDGFEFPQTFEGVRDKTMLEVFYSTGMRRAELIALRDGDVDFSALVIKVTGKRNKQRLIPFGDRLQEALSVYLQERTRFYSGECEAFFIRKGGVRLSPFICELYCEAIPFKGCDAEEEKPSCVAAYFCYIYVKPSGRAGGGKRIAGA